MIPMTINADKKSNSSSLTSQNWCWRADLELQLTAGEGGTRLTRNRHQGPLYVQKPFYPEGPECAHIYLLHPPGGLVSGDSLTLDIQLGNNAHAVMTTPGAARMYKAREQSPSQRQVAQLQVAEGAVLEWFPMETIVYTGAHAELQTTVKLEENSRFIGWEISCFGLPASQQLFESGQFKQQYRIEKNGLPVFIDHLYYDASQVYLFSGKAGMQSQPVSGFFIAGPFACSAEEKQRVSDDVRSEIIQAMLEEHMAITWTNDFCVLRYLGASAFDARRCFAKLWSLLRPVLIRREACEPRIWLT
jgi:urease accessory protein